MGKFKTRLLSACLAASLAITALPTVAFAGFGADEGTPSNGTTSVKKWGAQTGEDLEFAIQVFLLPETIYDGAKTEEDEKAVFAVLGDLGRANGSSRSAFSKYRTLDKSLWVFPTFNESDDTRVKLTYDFNTKTQTTFPVYTSLDSSRRLRGSSAVTDTDDDNIFTYTALKNLSSKDGLNFNVLASLFAGCGYDNWLYDARNCTGWQDINGGAWNEFIGDPLRDNYVAVREQACKSDDPYQWEYDNVILPFVELVGSSSLRAEVERRYEKRLPITLGYELYIPLMNTTKSDAEGKLAMVSLRAILDEANEYSQLSTNADGMYTKSISDHRWSNVQSGASESIFSGYISSLFTHAIWYCGDELLQSLRPAYAKDPKKLDNASIVDEAGYGWAFVSLCNPTFSDPSSSLVIDVTKTIDVISDDGSELPTSVITAAKSSSAAQVGYSNGIKYFLRSPISDQELATVLGVPVSDVDTVSEVAELLYNSDNVAKKTSAGIWNGYTDILKSGMDKIPSLLKWSSVSADLSATFKAQSLSLSTYEQYNKAAAADAKVDKVYLLLAEDSLSNDLPSEISSGGKLYASKWATAPVALLSFDLSDKTWELVDFAAKEDYAYGNQKGSITLGTTTYDAAKKQYICDVTIGNTLILTPSEVEEVAPDAAIADGVIVDVDDYVITDYDEAYGFADNKQTIYTHSEIVSSDGKELPAYSFDGTTPSIDLELDSLIENMKDGSEDGTQTLEAPKAGTEYKSDRNNYSYMINFINWVDDPDGKFSLVTDELQLRKYDALYVDNGAAFTIDDVLAMNIADIDIDNYEVVTSVDIPTMGTVTPPADGTKIEYAKDLIETGLSLDDVRTNLSEYSELCRDYAVYEALVSSSMNQMTYALQYWTKAAMAIYNESVGLTGEFATTAYPEVTLSGCLGNSHVVEGIYESKSEANYWRELKIRTDATGQPGAMAEALINAGASYTVERRWVGEHRYEFYIFKYFVPCDDGCIQLREDYEPRFKEPAKGPGYNPAAGSYYMTPGGPLDTDGDGVYDSSYGPTFYTYTSLNQYFITEDDYEPACETYSYEAIAKAGEVNEKAAKDLANQLQPLMAKLKAITGWDVEVLIPWTSYEGKGVCTHKACASGNYQCSHVCTSSCDYGCTHRCNWDGSCRKSVQCTHEHDDSCKSSGNGYGYANCTHECDEECKNLVTYKTLTTKTSYIKVTSSGIQTDNVTGSASTVKFSVKSTSGDHQIALSKAPSAISDLCVYFGFYKTNQSVSNSSGKLGGLLGDLVFVLGEQVDTALELEVNRPNAEIRVTEEYATAYNEADFQEANIPDWMLTMYWMNQKAFMAEGTEYLVNLLDYEGKALGATYLNNTINTEVDAYTPVVVGSNVVRDKEQPIFSVLQTVDVTKSGVPSSIKGIAQYFETNEGAGSATTKTYKPIYVWTYEDKTSYVIYDDLITNYADYAAMFADAATTTVGTQDTFATKANVYIVDLNEVCKLDGSTVTVSNFDALTYFYSKFDVWTSVWRLAGENNIVEISGDDWLTAWSEDFAVLGTLEDKGALLAASNIADEVVNSYIGDKLYKSVQMSSTIPTKGEDIISGKDIAVAGGNALADTGTTAVMNVEIQASAVRSDIDASYYMSQTATKVGTANSLVTSELTTAATAPAWTSSKAPYTLSSSFTLTSPDKDFIGKLYDKGASSVIEDFDELAEDQLEHDGSELGEGHYTRDNIYSVYPMVKMAYYAPVIEGGDLKSEYGYTFIAGQKPRKFHENVYYRMGVMGNADPTVVANAIASSQDAQRLQSAYNGAPVAYSGTGITVSYSPNLSIAIQTFALVNDDAGANYQIGWGNTDPTTVGSAHQEVLDSMGASSYSVESDGISTTLMGIPYVAGVNVTMTNKADGQVAEDVWQMSQGGAQVMLEANTGATSTSKIQLFVARGELIAVSVPSGIANLVDGQTSSSGFVPAGLYQGNTTKETFAALKAKDADLIVDALKGVGINTGDSCILKQTFAYNEGVAVTRDANGKFAEGLLSDGITGWYNEYVSCLSLEYQCTSFQLQPLIFTDKIPVELGPSTPADKSQYFSNGYGFVAENLMIKIGKENAENADLTGVGELVENIWYVTRFTDAGDAITEIPSDFADLVVSDVPVTNAN